MLTELLSKPDAGEDSQASLRQWYAGIALSALVAASNSDRDRAKTNIWKPDHIADKAVEVADAMLRRLNRP